jgi:hypothetical protein
VNLGALRRRARVRHRDRHPQGHLQQALRDGTRYSLRRRVETVHRYAEHRCSGVHSSDVNRSMVRRALHWASDDERPEVVESDGRMRSWGDPEVVESDGRSR